MSESPTLSDLDVAIAFEHALLLRGDLDEAMHYASETITVIEAPSTPYRSPIIGRAGLVQLREDVNRYSIADGTPDTEYFAVAPGLVVGRVRRNARLRSTGEPFDFRVTEWIRVVDGKVTEVEVYYFENAPLAAAAAETSTLPNIDASA